MTTQTRYEEQYENARVLSSNYQPSTIVVITNFRHSKKYSILDTASFIPNTQESKVHYQRNNVCALF